MKCVRLFEDETGVSRFEDQKIDLSLKDFAPPASLIASSEGEQATNLIFLTLPAGWTGPQHPSPCKQVLFCLSGSMLVEAENGDTREICQGDIWRMEDTSGLGHKTTVTSVEDMQAGIVQLE